MPTMEPACDPGMSAFFDSIDRMLGHGDDDRSSRVSFRDVTHRLGSPVEWVRPIDDRSDHSCFDELSQDVQVLVILKFDGRAPLLMQEQ